MSHHYLIPTGARLNTVAEVHAAFGPARQGVRFPDANAEFRQRLREAIEDEAQARSDQIRALARKGAVAYHGGAMRAICYGVAHAYEMRAVR